MIWDDSFVDAIVASWILAMMSLSIEQRITLALSKSISASLSLIASLILLYKIFLRFRDRRSSSTLSGRGRSSRRHVVGMTSYHRMIFSISLLDVIHSISSALSTILVPTSTGAVFAHGTIETCAAQGFFQQLTPTIVIYMAVMNTYFMLKIRYNVSDAVFHRRYELLFHAIPIVFFLITGTTGLSLKIFNAVLIPELGCWLGSYPLGCIFTNTLCTRGYKIAEYIDLYAWSFAYFWLFLSAAVVLLNSVLIYTTLHAQEEKNAKYFAARLQHGTSSNIAMYMSSSASNVIALEFDEFGLENDEPTPTAQEEEEGEEEEDYSKYEVTPESSPNLNGSGNDAQPSVPQVSAISNTVRRRIESHVAPNRGIPNSRIAAVQSSLYVASAFFTAIWIFLNWLAIRMGVSLEWKFFFAFMTSIVSPSQGVFNLFVFIRLQYLRLRRRESSWSRRRCIMHCLFSEDRQE